MTQQLMAHQSEQYALGSCQSAQGPGQGEWGQLPWVAWVLGVAAQAAGVAEQKELVMWQVPWLQPRWQMLPLLLPLPALQEAAVDHLGRRLELLPCLCLPRQGLHGLRVALRREQAL